MKIIKNQATRMKVREKRSVSTHTQREMADKVRLMVMMMLRMTMVMMVM